MTAGKFIVLEGIDGSGKTTVANHICTVLGRNAVFTSEPYNSGFVGKIEELLPFRDADSVAAKVLAFTADRAMHTRKIREWLGSGMHVVCDRYFMSTVAYQGAEFGTTRGRMIDWIRKTNEPFSELPDAVIYLDSDPEKAVARIGGRSSRLKAYEKAAFLEVVKRNYRSELRRFSGARFILKADVDISLLKQRAEAAAIRVVRGV